MCWLIPETLYNIPEMHTISLFRRSVVAKQRAHSESMVRCTILTYSKMNGAQAGVTFTLKAFFNLHPYQLLATSLLFSMVILAFAIRTFEVGLQNGNRFNYASNAM